LQAGVDNAMDLQYRTFSSGINAPGRNIFGAIRISL
jgi:hemoglobin/transferrin/lactoferrin receptor protein